MNRMKEQFEAAEGVEFPGKTYMDELLKPVFDDQKKYLFEAMFKIHKAHTIMLMEQGILTGDECTEILEAVKQVECIDRTELMYSSQHEDLFFLLSLG